MPSVTNQQLIDAAKAGDLSVLKEWKKQNKTQNEGDGVNCKDHDGWTPLHWACCNGQLECVKYLIESCEADISCKTNSGCTPLHWACYNGQLECVKYLIESCEADINCKDNNDSTPLHWACYGGHLECVAYLIASANADVNIQDNDNKTPLDVIGAKLPVKMIKCLDDLSHRNSQLQEQLEENEQENEQLKRQLEQKEEEKTQKEQENEQLKQQLEQKEEEKTQKEQENEQLKQQLEQEKESTQRLLSKSQLENEQLKRKLKQHLKISIDQDRCAAVHAEAIADVTFLCGQGDEQQPIKANSAVLMITVPSIQTLINSGIQHQCAHDGAHDGAQDTTEPIQTTIPLPNFQPKHVRYVLQCIYRGEISFNNNAHDFAGDDDANQPTPTLTGQDDLQQLILVANEFGFWRLKLVLEAELARKHLTEDAMIDVLIFADQHNCLVLKDAAMRMAAEREKDMFTHPDFSKLIPHHQLMGGIHVVRSGGAESDGVDGEYSHMSMVELYKVTDQDEGTAQVDSYMDRVALVDFVRCMSTN